MNVSSVGSNAYLHVAQAGRKPADAATTTVQPQAAASVDADGDHDGDTAAGDRLDLRG